MQQTFTILLPLSRDAKVIILSPRKSRYYDKGSAWSPIFLLLSHRSMSLRDSRRNHGRVDQPVDRSLACLWTSGPRVTVYVTCETSVQSPMLTALPSILPELKSQTVFTFAHN